MSEVVYQIKKCVAFKGELYTSYMDEVNDINDVKKWIENNTENGTIVFLICPVIKENNDRTL